MVAPPLTVGGVPWEAPPTVHNIGYSDVGYSELVLLRG